MARKKTTEISNQNSGDVLENKGAQSSVETLKRIGLKEISTKTYIDLNYLKLMVAKDFSNLQRIKTLGFVKIIQREYNIDMSDWVSEFDDYLKSVIPDSEERDKTNEILEEHAQTDRRKKIYVAVSVLLFIALIAFAYAFFHGRNNYAQDVFDNQNITYADSFSDIDFIEPATENITTETDVAQESDATKTDTVDTNSSGVANVTTEISALPPAIQGDVYIIPNIELWVGIIDIQTSEKKTHLIKKGLNINTSKEQLVITGHGDFTLKSDNGSSQSFNTKKRVFMHIKDGAVNLIDESEFISLNNGVVW